MIEIHESRICRDSDHRLIRDMRRKFSVQRCKNRGFTTHIEGKLKLIIAQKACTAAFGMPASNCAPGLAFDFEAWLKPMS